MTATAGSRPTLPNSIPPNTAAMPKRRTIAAHVAWRSLFLRMAVARAIRVPFGAAALRAAQELEMSPPSCMGRAGRRLAPAPTLRECIFLGAMLDRIHDIWGQRAPYADSEWPSRLDEHVVEEPERWVQSACV